MKTLTTPIAIIISGIVIAISIGVSTKMYVDANKYTFVSIPPQDPDNVFENVKHYAFTQEGQIYSRENGTFWSGIHLDFPKLP